MKTKIKKSLIDDHLRTTCWLFSEHFATALGIILIMGGGSIPLLYKYQLAQNWQHGLPRAGEEVQRSVRAILNLWFRW